MKIGDQFVVRIEGIDVARADVVAVNNEQVELVIPATRVVMAVKTSIAPVEAPEPEKEVIIDGVEVVSESAVEAQQPVETPVETETNTTEVEAQPQNTEPADAPVETEVPSETTVESTQDS